LTGATSNFDSVYDFQLKPHRVPGPLAMNITTARISEQIKFDLFNQIV